MQQLKSKIKPPFLLDGIQVARKRKLLDYKPERDAHLEQYFYNLHMRQMVSKLKAEQQLSRRSLSQSKSKSFDKTIVYLQITQQSKTNLNKSSSPNRSAIKLPQQQVPKQMSKENFITFLDSLITTVQNVQQLVITYFPKEDFDDKILQQQKELNQINNATEQLTKKLRATSLVENEKTQKNFTKLPKLNKKVVTYAKSKTERAHNTSYRKTPKLIQNTLPKNQQNSQEYENPGFEPYESIHDQSTKKSVEQNPIVEANKPQKSGQIQLPTVKGSTQKKYQKEIQLILTKPKQYNNNSCITTPDQFKSKSVGNREMLPRSQSKQIPKFDIQKSIGLKKTDQNKSKVQINKTIPIQIKINQVDQQEEQTQQNRKPEVEVVEDVVRNFSNESELFPTQVITDQDKIKDEQKLEGTACFKIQEVEERKETIGRMSESNELPKYQDANKEFFQMIKTQADKNDEIMLQQQETVKDSIQEGEPVNQNDCNFKIVQSIEPKNEDFVVNPLEDSSEDQKLQTLEPKQVEEQYKQEFDQED